MSDQPDTESGVDIPASLHTRLVDDKNLQAVLHRVAAAGVQLLSGCESASVTIIERTRPTTIASTSDAAVVADRAQYAANDGPCLTAAREGRVIGIDDVRDERRWAGFRDAALAQGLYASLSLPLFLTGDTQGGLNMYAATPGAFNDDDERIASAFAAQASVVVANAQAYWATFDATQNLTIALEHRAVIERAKGVLIAHHGYSDDDAFAELRRRSQHANQKLRDVAAELVEAARHEPRP
jgi:GAF domain-containing protein